MTASDIQRTIDAVWRIESAKLIAALARLVRDVGLAEDLAQDTLVEAWKSLHRYNGRCQFFTWLCAILLNRHRNTLRQNRRQPAATRDQNEHANQLPDHAALPDQAAEARERSALVQQCIQSLPAKHQQVIYLRFYVDDSLEGIAAALGCSVGTVKSRLFHALDKLRKMNAFSTQRSDFKTKGGML